VWGSGTQRRGERGEGKEEEEEEEEALQADVHNVWRNVGPKWEYRCGKRQRENAASHRTPQELFIYLCSRVPARLISHTISRERPFALYFGHLSDVLYLFKSDFISQWPNERITCKLAYIYLRDNGMNYKSKFVIHTFLYNLKKDCKTWNSAQINEKYKIAINYQHDTFFFKML